MPIPVLSTSGLRINIGGKTICRCLNLALAPGQCWGLLGRNGAGKTTILHTLAGLYPPEHGKVVLDGQELSKWNRRTIARRLGLLLQQRNINFPATVEALVLAGRYPHLGSWGIPGTVDRAIATAALAQVSMAGSEHRLLSRLSGGEQQRVYLAALFTQQPQILLLDEPGAHLDLAEQYRLLRLLRSLADQGHVVLMSLHDLNQALLVCDHLLLLHHGHALTGPIAKLGTAKLLARIFGIPLTRIKGPMGELLVPFDNNFLSKTCDTINIM